MKQQSAAPKSGAFDPFTTITCERFVFRVYTFMAYKNIKVQKTVYFQYSKSQKGHYSYKN